LFKTLPSEVVAVIREFRVCEFSTMGKDGTPVTWPVATLYRPEEGWFLLTTTIGFPQKALNIRRNPRVSLLFSDPTGSGLENPPAVLIQGDATAPDEIVTAVDGLEDYWRTSIFGRQPSSAMISGNSLMRRLMDFYYMRILIYVVPKALYWWPEGNFLQPAHR
jgi:nitroimidazol reductase NimA-like FMN-containing flavoprotein (pyridoxamine 5'-phosphate oxidase superfamily)